VGRTMKRIGCIFTLSLCFVGPVLAAPPLPNYGIDINQTSVSGVSSGGAMAVQMHVAHSSIMRGVGVIAGVTYDCANSDLPSASASKIQGASCMDGSIDYANDSIGRTDSAAAHGYIDNPGKLAGQKVWLFSGYNDGLVRRKAMNTVAKYYEHYLGNVFYKNNSHAPHALITNHSGGPCLDVNHDFLNNCNYDAAGFLLKHIYGRLNPPSSNSSGGSILAFDQTEFVDPALVGRVGLADTGYVYVPNACKTTTCRVHIVFHGCLQYAGRVNNAVYENAGYNKWADTNNFIVLYPQTEPIGTLPLGDNPQGCWDWWGLSDTLSGNREFARKTGYQISAIRRMLDRLAQGSVSGGGSSDTFGKPQHFSVADNTSSAIALTWQPNSAATGFNIYRSTSSAGTYTKINSNPLLNASFGDQGLSPNTTYYYKISAIDGSNHESAKTGPVHKKTASKPPACDPYFSDNELHVTLGRAFAGFDKGQVVAQAVGSLEVMGPIDWDHFSELIKDDVLWPSYHVRYCP